MAAAPAAGPVLFMSASPATISFQANDPDSPSDPGNSAATVGWWSYGGNGAAWSLTARAAASTFSNCPTVPVSAVTVSCTSATVSGGSGSCRPPFTLSTSPQNIAVGTQGALSQYTVNLTFTLSDSWKFIAQLSPSCSLSITYTATLN